MDSLWTPRNMDEHSEISHHLMDSAMKQSTCQSVSQNILISQNV